MSENKDLREKSKKISSLALLFPYIAPYWRRIVLGTLALMVSTTCMMAIPQYIKHMFDVVFESGDVNALHQMLVYLGLTTLLLVVAMYARTWFLRFAGVLVTVAIQKKLYTHVMNQDQLFFEKVRTGEVVSRLLSDVVLIREAVILHIPVLLRAVFLLVASIIMLFITNVKMTLILAALAPVLIGAVFLSSSQWRRAAAKIQEKSADIGSHVEETVNNVHTVHAFSQTESEVLRLGSHVEEAKKIARKLIHSIAGFMTLSLTVGMAGVILILLIGGHSVLDGTFTAGEMLAYVLYLSFLSDAVGGFTEGLPAMQMAAGATERIFNLLETESHIKEPAKEKPLKKATKGRAMELKGLTFNYQSRPETPALQEINLKIPAGKTVAVVGRSGAGKSTLISLLMRFYDAQKGSIMLDGVNIKDLKLQTLRHEVAWVSQEAAVFSGSIIDNIRYGRPEASMEEVQKAAHIAHADEFIQKMPQGYNSIVGEKGVRLSGGQKQRLAIARTVLCNPQVLLLDEATSHLDAESEKKVQEAFETLMQNRTTLVIAHRLATVKAADLTVVMDEGKILAVGTHAELLKKSKLYKSLAALQFIDE